MLECIDKLNVLMTDVSIEDFNENFVIHIGAERLLEILGEAAARMNVNFKAKYTRVPWEEMRALRNIISHEYFDVDYNALWDVIQNDIPELKQALMEIKAKENFDCWNQKVTLQCWFLYAKAFLHVLLTFTFALNEKTLGKYSPQTVVQNCKQ